MAIVARPLDKHHSAFRFGAFKAQEKAAAAKQKAEAKDAGKKGKDQASGNDPTNSK